MLLGRMVARETVCLRRLAGGDRGCEVGFGRFLANARVTAAALIAGWSEGTAAAVDGRHVLAIQDTSEITFATKAERRRGLGKIGKGGGHGALIHAMIALDASTGTCLGLVAGCAWTREDGNVTIPHAARLLEDKESRRWVETAAAAKPVLARAARVTVVADRESDIYTQWATTPEAGVHLLTRVWHDRRLVGGGLLSEAALALPPSAPRVVALRETATRKARDATLSLRFTEVAIQRPKTPDAKGLAKAVALTLVEVIETEPPQGAEPVLWRLLTTHAVADVEAAWQIVDWYRRRWAIEQLFRLMKTDGLRLEDSQLADAASLVKLAIIATKAATTILQLVQARDGVGTEPASLAFDDTEQKLLAHLDARRPARTDKQRNPHPPGSLAWAAYVIARLGGWDGYASSRPPGPITFRHGLEYFKALANGWKMHNDACMP